LHYNRDRDSINIVCLIIAEEQVETMLLILCDQLEAQDSSKAWHHLSVAQKQRFGKIVGR
jgi:hypothetical protein